jgi:hypothetical protein
MKGYIIFNKEDGTILHVHWVVDAPSRSSATLKKEAILSKLSDFFPKPEKVDVLAIDSSQPLDLRNTRVNPTERKLEEIPRKSEE